MTIEHLNKPIMIGNKIVPNRIVYQPTEGNNCDENGSATEYTFEKYRRNAAGHPGILHIESIDVTTKTQARSNRMLIMEENLELLASLVEAIRGINNKTLILFQLSHAGRLSDPQFKSGYSVYDAGDGVRVMTTEEIHAAREEFILAALRAEEVGADGIDFKQAHGFLGDDFLHPANQREDGYGGSFENRTRFFKETYHGMRDRLKSDNFIIGSRLSPYEGIPGGFGTSSTDGMIEDLSEPIRFARLMEKEGIDFINVSGGYASANLELLMPTDTYPEGVFRHFNWTSSVKHAVKIPVIGSGYSYLKDGNTSIFGSNATVKSLLYWGERNIAEGNTDMVGIGRQVIADPGFAYKVLSGRIDEINWCTTCSGCGILLGNNLRIGCSHHQKEYADLLKTVE